MHSLPNSNLKKRIILVYYNLVLIVLAFISVDYDDAVVTKVRQVLVAQENYNK